MDSVFLALAIAALPVAGAIAVVAVPRWSEAREYRRTRYAHAVEGLVAWAEFPYRIARRVNDEPETLAGLAELGHELQERLVFHSSWIAAESRMMGQLYDGAIGALRRATGPAATRAWQAPPVESAADMNVGDLGVDGDAVTAIAVRVASASRSRFGWRRLLGRLNAKRKVFSAPIEEPVAVSDVKPVSNERDRNRAQ